MLDLVDDIFEQLEIFESGVEGIKVMKGDAPFFLIRSVAGDAVLFEEGLDLVRKGIGPSGCEGAKEDQKKRAHFGVDTG